MACLSSTTRTVLKARLEKLTARLTALSDTIDKAIERGHLSGIEFDSGDGKEKSTYRNINEIRRYEKEIENEISRIEDRLNCAGLVNLRLVR
jgi:chromosome segregation ATPase